MPNTTLWKVLNALQSFRDDYGGNWIYLGGDGFYWRIAAEVPTPEDSDGELDSASLLEISTLGPPNQDQENIIMSLARAPLLHTEGFGGVWIVHRNDLWGVGFTAQRKFGRNAVSAYIPVMTAKWIGYSRVWRSMKLLW